MGIIKIYGDLQSGNCLKVKYTCDFLAIPYEWVKIDILKNQTNTPEFLAMNAAGQVPVIELRPGHYLAQSNAIIKYLARTSDLIPKDDFLAAKMDEWLFWEQYSHEPAVAVLRFQIHYLKKSLQEVDPKLIQKSYHALDRMEQQLILNRFILGSHFSLADISLVAYTRLASEANLDLTKYPCVSAWINACEKKLGLI